MLHPNVLNSAPGSFFFCQHSDVVDLYEWISGYSQFSVVKKTTCSNFRLYFRGNVHLLEWRYLRKYVHLNHEATDPVSRVIMQAKKD